MHCMYVEMWINKVLVERYQVSITGLRTTDERQGYMESVAAALYKKHIKKINQSNEDPVFYVDEVRSKIELLYVPSWQQIIKKHGSQTAKKNMWAMIDKITEKQSV